MKQSNFEPKWLLTKMKMKMQMKKKMMMKKKKKKKMMMMKATAKEEGGRRKEGRPLVHAAASAGLRGRGTDSAPAGASRPSFPRP